MTWLIFWLVSGWLGGFILVTVLTHPNSNHHSSMTRGDALWVMIIGSLVGFVIFLYSLLLLIDWYADYTGFNKKWSAFWGVPLGKQKKEKK